MYIQQLHMIAQYSMYVYILQNKATFELVHLCTCLKNKGSSHTHWKEQHSKAEVHNKVPSSITPLQQPSTHTICACSLKKITSLPLLFAYQNFIHCKAATWTSPCKPCPPAMQLRRWQCWWWNKGCEKRLVQQLLASCKQETPRMH